MLPLYLLMSAKNQPILVELKNGETLNGNLVICDSWMNLTLSNVIQSSANGDKFYKLPEVYVRGNHIKYLRLPNQVMDHVKAVESQKQHNNGQGNNRRDNRNYQRRDNRNNNGNNGNNNRYNNNNRRNNNQGYRKNNAGNNSNQHQPEPQQANY